MNKRPSQRTSLRAMHKVEELARMKNRACWLSCVAISLLISLSCVVATVSGQGAKQPHKEVAVSMDDLPLNGSPLRIEDMQAMMQRLASKLHDEKVPVTGFVNEKILYEKTGQVDARIALLQLWLDHGLDLANHTFSHLNLGTTSVRDFEEDIVRGETVTGKLLAEKGKKLQYFRYPFLSTGATLSDKLSVHEFLGAHHYEIAPATVDAQDWLFSEAYTKAKLRGDTPLCKDVARAYLAYADKMFDYSEKMAEDIAGRNVRQILVLHCNPLNADYFDELVKVMRAKNYDFITLEAALKDPVYRMEDTYLSKDGCSWLKRCLLSQGKSALEPEPRPPEFVVKLYSEKR